MLAFEDARQAGHAVLVERIGMMVARRATRRGCRLRRARCGTRRSWRPASKRGWKSACTSSRGEHADGGRQQAVHGAPQIGQRDRVFDGERRHLRQRVHAGIGAPEAGHVHRRAFDAGDDLFQQRPGWSAGRAAPASRETGRRRRRVGCVCGASRRARAGLDHRNALAAQRAFFGMMGRHLQRGQRHARHAHGGRAAAAVDNGTGRQHPCPPRREALRSRPACCRRW